MKKFFVASASVASLIVLVPTAQAKAPTRRHVGVYYYLRRHVIALDGRTAPGRNVLKDGRSDGRPVTDAVIRQSNTVMERMLAPPPQVVAPSSPVATSTTGSTPSLAVVTSTSHMQCIISHESGGNPQATNGQYAGIGQWSPSAWAQDGGTKYAPSPLGASLGQQTQVLASEGDAGMSSQQGQYDGCG